MDLAIRLRMRSEIRRRANRLHRANLLELRLQSTPFDIPEFRSQKLFRLSKSCARNLIRKLENFNMSLNIPFEIQVLTALHFYGHGSYQVSVGSNHLLALSQPSVSRCIRNVTSLINNHILKDVIKFPDSVLMKAEIKEGFNAKFNMTGIIGAIDGFHIAIIGPPEDDENLRGSLYRNRKGYHSINALVCCDSRMRITYADSRFPGSVHDSAIWHTSPLRRQFLNLYTRVENQNAFLIGDSGFPLEPWLLTPFLTTTEGTPEYIFNKKFIKARNIIEKCFGVVKSRFRCLSRHRVLHYDPGTAGLIIYAVFCLHNICLNECQDLYELSDNEESSDEDIYDELPNSVESASDNTRIRQWHLLGAEVRQRSFN